MKHIRRKITVSVLGTMLFVFAVLLATVNIFIPEYLTSEAQKAILLEDERKDPIPLTEITDEGEEHFLASSVRYLEVEEGLTESEHLSKAEYQLRKYCREERPAADEFHTLKTGGSRFVFRISQVEADEYEDALGAYLVKLSAKSLNESDSQKVSILLHAISDFEKMTDYTADLVFTAREKRDKDVHFSDKARQEITIMVNAVGEIIDLTISAFSKDDVKLANKVEPLEDVIDRLRNDLKNRHIKRMQEGRCSVNQGFVFTDYITALEKISDHCANVAAAIIELNDENYDVHHVMSNRRNNPEYKELCVEFGKKYILPFSVSSEVE